MKRYSIKFDEIITDKDYENSSIGIELGKSEIQIEAELAFNKVFYGSKTSKIPSFCTKSRKRT